MADDFVKKEFSEEEILWNNKEEALLDEMGVTREEGNYLRKQMLSHEEAIAAKTEEINTIRIKKGRKDNWQEFLDMKSKMGRAYSGNDFAYLLRKILPKLLVYDAPVVGTLGLLSPVVRQFDDGYHPGWEYLGWVYKDWNPEYTIDYMDDNGVLTGKKRQGWRGFLLLNQIKKDGTGSWTLKGTQVVQDGTGLPLKILTEESVNKVFGYPSGGDGRSMYRRQLHRFRHGLKGDVDHTKWF